MKDWEIQTIKLYNEIAMLEAWLHGLTVGNEKIYIAYALERIEEITKLLPQFEHMNLKKGK